MESSKFEVRPVRDDELTATGEVTAAGYLADGLLTRADGTFDMAYRSRLLDTRLRAREADVLVAVEGSTVGVVLGTVTWCPPGSAWRELAIAEDQGEFRMLSVAPAGRGQGIGQALVADCLLRARRRDAGGAAFFTADDDRRPSPLRTQRIRPRRRTGPFSQSRARALGLPVAALKAGLEVRRRCPTASLRNGVPAVRGRLSTSRLTSTDEQVNR